MRKFILGTLLGLSLLMPTVAHAETWSVENTGTKETRAEFPVVGGKPQWQWKIARDKASYLRYDTGITTTNWYKITGGLFFWYGASPYTTEYGGSFQSALPRTPDSLYGYSKESVNLYGYGQINAIDNFAFDADETETKWEKGPSDLAFWDVRLGKYIKHVNTVYWREEAKPSTPWLTVSGETYKNGNDYWIRPGQTVNITASGATVPKGSKGMPLSDYTNQLSVVYKDAAGNDVDTYSKFIGRDNEEVKTTQHRTQPGHALWATDAWRHTLKGNADYLGRYRTGMKIEYKMRIDAYDYDMAELRVHHRAANNRWVNSFETERVRTDGSTPYAVNNRTAASNTHLNIDLDVTDSRSGLQSNSVYAHIYPVGGSANGSNRVQLSSPNNFSYSAYGINLESYLSGHSGMYKVMVYGTDNVGNTGLISDNTFEYISEVITTNNIHYSGGGIHRDGVYYVKSGSSFTMYANHHTTASGHYPDWAEHRFKPAGLTESYMQTDWNKLQGSYINFEGIGINNRGFGNSESWSTQSFGSGIRDGFVPTSSIAWRNGIYGNTYHDRTLYLDNSSPTIMFQRTSNVAGRVRVFDSGSGINFNNSFVRVGNVNHPLHRVSDTEGYLVVDFSNPTGHLNALKDFKYPSSEVINNNHWAFNIDVHATDKLGNLGARTYSRVPFIAHSPSEIHLSDSGDHATVYLGQYYFSDNPYEMSPRALFVGNGERVTKYTRHRQYHTFRFDDTKAPGQPSARATENALITLTHGKDSSETKRYGVGYTEAFYPSENVYYSDRTWMSGEDHTMVSIAGKTGLATGHRSEHKIALETKEFNLHDYVTKPGDYDLTFITYDEAGNPSKPYTIRTKIVGIEGSFYIKASRDTKHKSLLSRPAVVPESGGYNFSSAGNPRKGFYVDYMFDCTNSLPVSDFTFTHTFVDKRTGRIISSWSSDLGTDTGSKFFKDSPHNYKHSGGRPQGVGSYTGKVFIPIDKIPNVSSENVLVKVHMSATVQGYPKTLTKELCTFDLTQSALDDFQMDKDA